MGRRSERKRAAVGVKAPAAVEPADAGRVATVENAAAAPSAIENWVRDHRAVLAAGGLLVLGVTLVFGQTLGHGFVNIDDPLYVYSNPAIKYGLSWQAIGRAFTQSHAHNWHPLTTLSHMLDCQLFGLRAGGHHLVCLLLHAATAVVLMLAFFRMTGRLWASGLTAALFAIHPLRAESVAWIAERKDVLSGFFFAATLWAYADFAKKPFSWRSYGLVAAFFALGLLCKPMLVTLPFVLLLLDYWPLGRWQVPRLRPFSLSPCLPFSLSSSRLIVEKLPLLAMAVPVAVATAVIQRKAMQLNEVVPLLTRGENAAIACWSYLGKLVYPRGLAAFYPYGLDARMPWRAGVASLALVLITLAAVHWRRRQPQILVGWLWYLGMLVPVIGLVQVGSQSMADRYTYLPQIGIVMALAFSLAPLAPRRLVSWRGLGAAVVTGALLVLGWQQVSVWRDGEVLWRHALSCTPPSTTALLNLGGGLKAKGRLEEAVKSYQAALELDPRLVAANNDVGVVLGTLGRPKEAAEYFYKAIAVDAECASAYANLGQCLHCQDRVEDAAKLYRQALEFEPDHENAQRNLAISLLQTGHDEEAQELFQRSHAGPAEISAKCCELADSLRAGKHFAAAVKLLQKCLEIDPDSVPVHDGIRLANHDWAAAYHERALAELAQGKAGDAIRWWQSAVALRPEGATIYNDPAWVMATWPDAAFRNGKAAVALAQRAVQISGRKEPAALDTLAAAYAEEGRFQDAVGTAKEALQLATAQGNQRLAESLGKRIKLYGAGQPWRDSPPPRPAKGR